jgi:hypothetical protein
MTKWVRGVNFHLFEMRHALVRMCYFRQIRKEMRHFAQRQSSWKHLLVWIRTKGSCRLLPHDAVWPRAPSPGRHVTVPRVLVPRRQGTGGHLPSCRTDRRGDWMADEFLERVLNIDMDDHPRWLTGWNQESASLQVIPAEWASASNLIRSAHCSHIS